MGPASTRAEGRENEHPACGGLGSLRKEIERALVEIAGVERVVLTSSVADTRAATSGEAFDLIMLDLALGDGTALDLLNDPPAGMRAGHPPVIILTIHASKALCERCLAAGASSAWSGRSRPL